MFLGDREVGKGAPVDQLDKACRSLKQCHKCAQGEFLICKKSRVWKLPYAIDPMIWSISLLVGLV